MTAASDKARQAVQVYTKGTVAWFSDKQEGWVSATCVSTSINDDNVRLVFQDDNDDSKVGLIRT